MITRVVKLTFRASEVENFLQIFNDTKEQIRNFDGCHYLELWNDTHHPNIFFTYSKWENLATLEAYRTSILFKQVWVKTKLLFADRPEAWSVNVNTVLK